MPDTVLRPPTPQERKSIKEAMVATPGLGAHLANLGCITMFLFLGVVLLSRLFGILKGQEPWLMLGCLAVGLVVTLRLRAKMAQYMPKPAADETEAMVEEATYDLTEALRVEELEDEGSSYYLKLAEGGVLFLSGQYLYESEEQGTFPSTRVKTTRSTASHRLLLDIACLGTPLKATGTLPAFTLEQLESGEAPEDGDLLAVDFEALKLKAKA